MQFRFNSPMLDGWAGNDTVATNLDAAADGSAVLVLEEMGPVKPEEATMFELEIVVATDEERSALPTVGFSIPA